MYYIEISHYECLCMVHWGRFPAPCSGSSVVLISVCFLNRIDSRFSKMGNSGSAGKEIWEGLVGWLPSWGWCYYRSTGFLTRFLGCRLGNCHVNLLSHVSWLSQDLGKASLSCPSYSSTYYCPHLLRIPRPRPSHPPPHTFLHLLATLKIWICFYLGSNWFP